MTMKTGRTACSHRRQGEISSRALGSINHTHYTGVSRTRRGWLLEKEHSGELDSSLKKKKVKKKRFTKRDTLKPVKQKEWLQ